MSKEQEHEAPASPIQERQARRWKDLGGAWSVFRWLVVTATAWYLLKELAPILRPLLLAIFLAYVILPIRVYVQGQTRGGLGHLTLFVGLCLILAAFGVIAYGDVVGLAHDVPRLHQRVNDVTAEATRYADAHIPALADTIRRTAFAEEQGAARLQDALGSLVNMTAGVAIEAVQVAFFLILILFEAARFPRRMQNAFANEKTDRVFTMVGSINAAIASYLKAKVRVNIVLAVPAMLVLWIFGIKYVVFWGALTFLANFVPYLGSVVACGLPILFGFLDLDFGWQPIAAAILLVGVHVSSAYVVEPAMTGKAVDLSPLVVLIALSFWGLCWGLVGMVLAVPLTAVLKIILGNTPSTRPIAELMGGE